MVWQRRGEYVGLDRGEECFGAAGQLLREIIMGDQMRQRSRWALWGFLAVAAFFLWTEHRAHVMGLLPYLLLLACPLMHLFHHHGHGHRHGREEHHEP